MSMPTLTCSEARELVASRELGFELEGDRREALDTHLAACDGCRQAFLEEQELSSLLESNAMCCVESCEALGDRIARDLPERVPGPRRSFPFVRLEAVAAVLLFGVGLFVGTLFNRSVTPPGPESSRPVAVELPLMVGEAGRIGHELLPRDRLKTTGFNKILLVDPKNPDMQVEVDFQTSFEDVPTGPEYR
jgi:hypothetical protein